MNDATTFPLVDEPQVVAQPLDTYLPDPAPAPFASNVPRNIEEVSAQMSMALEGEGPMPVRMAEHASTIKAGGHSSLLGMVLSEDFEETIVGARAQALAYAKQQDAGRAQYAAQQALAMEKRKTAATPENSPVEAQQAVASRALENITGLERAQRMYADMGVFSRELDGAAGDVATRNLLAQASGGLEGEATMWEKLGQIGRSLLPFVDDVSMARTVSKVVGKDFYLDKFGAIQEFRNYMLGLPPLQRREVVKRLVGELSSNKAVSADMLRQLSELSKEEANMQMAFNVMDATDLGFLFSGLASLARKGVPIKAVHNVAGEKAAGEMALTDLTTKGKISGLNDEELIARVLSAGRNPLELDPAALAGMAPHAQAKLVTDWNDLLGSIKERLNSSSLSPEEVSIAAAEVRASWAQKTNKRIYSVEYGEASADGQKLVVSWQDKNGSPFMSRAAAEEFAKERGLLDFEIVPKNAALPLRLAQDDAVTFTQTAFRKIGEGEVVGTGPVHDRHKLPGGWQSDLSKWEAGFLDTDGKFYTRAEAAEAVGVAGKLRSEDYGGATVGVRLNDGLDLAAEIASLKVDMVPAIKHAIKDIEKKIKFYEKNYNSEVAVDLLMYKQWKLRATEILENSNTIKDYHEVEEWFQYADEFLREFDGGPKPKAVKTEPKLKAKLRATTDINDIGKVLKGESLDDILELLKTDGFLGKSVALDSILNQWAEGLSKGHSSLSARRVLKALAEGSQDRAYRQLANQLLAKNTLLWEGVGVNWYRQIVGAPPSALGGYDPLSDSIQIKAGSLLKLSGREAEETLLHELIHAHNAQVITSVLRDTGGLGRRATLDQVAAVGELRDLQLRLREWAAKGPHHLGMREEFGLQHALEFPDELLTYGLTDPFVRELLQQIKLKDLGYGHNEQTVWSSLWNIFKRVLGFTGSGDDTALAKLYDTFNKLVDSVEETQRSAVSRGIKAGSVSLDKANQMFGSSYHKKPHITLKAGATGEYLVRERRNDPLAYNNVGKFTKGDVESMPFVALDPKHQASEQGVEARVVGVHAEAKTKADLSNYIQPYYKGLNKEGVARVQSVLEEGDSFSNGGAVGREFTYSEVRAKGLSEEEAAAYMATRQLRMAMYHIRNGEMVRHLRSQGFKEIELNGTDIKTAGKVVPLEGVGKHTGVPLYNSTTKTTTTLTEQEMAAAYGSGKRVVTLAKPVPIEGEMRQTFLVDNTTATSRDITTALHYRPGEFSRIYSDEYFITMKRNVKVDGKAEEVVETIRTARSAREAEDFTTKVGAALNVLRNKGNSRQVQELVADYFDVDEFVAAFKAGDFDGFSGLEHHFTRNKEEYLNGSVNEALANGRLFTSKRSERLFSTDRTRENTLGVFESLEAEITNISRVANINQWRETMVRRWMNTFGDLIPNKTGNDIADFYAAAGATFTKGSAEAVFAERTHKYIMRQIGVRTGEERYYEQLTRRMTEKFFTGGEKLEGVGSLIRQKGVLSFLRNANFNLMLGMFNPAQLIVQANGAATAMILSPLHGVVAAKTFPLLRMALMSDNPKVWDFFAKMGGGSDLPDLVKAVRQTGIIDNLRSTSLYNMEDGKLNIFGAYPSKIVGASTFFFNRGEEFSRLVSFDVSRREWQAAHPELDWRSKEALAAIVVRQDDLTQNMTKANLARFQEGAVSIPLQFAQYNIKLAVNVMSALLGKGEGRGFTRAEAVALMGGHILLYGAAGNGLMGLMDEMLPDDLKEQMPVAMKTYLAQGLMSGLLSQVGEVLTGERTNVALGSRLGAFDYYQKLANAIFTDPKNVYDALLGPSVSTARRLGVIGDVSALWIKDPDLSAKDIMEGLVLMTTEQVTTLRNASKAYLFHQHANKMIDRNGFPVAQLTPMEVMGQALGFQPTVAVDVHNLIKTKKEHDEAIGDIATTIFQVQKQIMRSRLEGNHAYADEQHKLLTALWPVNTGDFMEVQRRIRDKLYPYDTQMQKLLGEYLYKGQTYDKPMVVTQPPVEPRKQ